MNAPVSSKLYSPELLALSTSLANYPLDGDFAASAETRSRTCGSVLRLGLDLSDEGAVTRIGMQVSACAVGQSSAAIMAQDAQRRTRADFERALAQIENWLSGTGSLPEWPRFGALEPALEHKGRHGALLLPWRAAVEALSSGGATR